MHLHKQYINHKAAKGDPMAMPHKFTSEMLPAKRSGVVAAEWVVGMLRAIRRRYCHSKVSICVFLGRPNAPRQRAIRQIFALGFAGLLVGSSPGCTILSNMGSVFSASDACDEFMIGHRNSVMAAKAWYRVKPHYRNHPHRNSFRDGFIAGYIDVAEGGAGCTPSVAPSEYWGWQYQSPEGQQATNAWFEGFPHGAQAAEQDGVGHWGNIQLVGPQEPDESQPPMVEEVPAAESPHADGSPHAAGSADRVGRPSGSEELPAPAETTPFEISPLPAETSGEATPTDGEPVQPIEGGLGSVRTDAIGGENGRPGRDGGDDAGLSFRFE